MGRIYPFQDPIARGGLYSRGIAQLMYLAMERRKPKNLGPIRGVSLRVLAPAQAACLLFPILVKATGCGVEIKEARAGLWELAAWVEEERFSQRLVARLKHTCKSLSRHLDQISLEWEPMERDKPPCKGEKRFFRAFQVTSSLWVGPLGTNVALKHGQSLLQMELGRAPHSGIEPSSQCALKLLEDLLAQEPLARALDLRTGTGLFSMAAALWGVQEVLALDTDPHAVAVARKNVKRNGLGHAIKIRCLAVRRECGCYPLVVAMSSHKLILREAKHLLGRIAPGGWLLVGGIWHRWVEACLASLCPPLELVARKRDVWWEALVLRRPATGASEGSPHGK